MTDHMERQSATKTNCNAGNDMPEINSVALLQSLTQLLQLAVQ